MTAAHEQNIFPNKIEFQHIMMTNDTGQLRMAHGKLNHRIDISKPHHHDSNTTPLPLLNHNGLTLL
jgi:hypothetical protein